MRIEVRFSQVGDISDGTIVQWKKRPGDAVSEGEAIAEIETGKANIDFEAPVSGVLSEILAAQGATVHVGDVLAVINAA